MLNLSISKGDPNVVMKLNEQNWCIQAYLPLCYMRSWKEAIKKNENVYCITIWACQNSVLFSITTDHSLSINWLSNNVWQTYMAESGEKTQCDNLKSSLSVSMFDPLSPFNILAGKWICPQKHASVTSDNCSETRYLS